MPFGRMGARYGRMGASGTVAVDRPTAPVLSVVSVVGTTVTLSFVVDETIGEGDYRQVQIQEDGGDWTSTIVDSTAALTSGEAGASELEIDIPTPDAGTYDVRMRVREGSDGPWSDWSNVDEYVIEEAGDPPVPTYLWEGQLSNASTATSAGQDFGTIPTGGLSVYGVVICPSDWFTISSCAVTPDGGAPIAGTIVVDFVDDDIGMPNVGIVRFAIPEGTTGMDNAVVTVTYGGSPFSPSTFIAFGVPTANLSSPTEVDAATAAVNPGTAPTVDVETALDGFMICGAASADVSSNSCTWTGDASPTERYEVTGIGMQHGAADASGTSADASSTVTATFVNSAKARISVASFR